MCRPLFQSVAAFFGSYPIRVKSDTLATEIKGKQRKTKENKGNHILLWSDGLKKAVSIFTNAGKPPDFDSSTQ